MQRSSRGEVEQIMCAKEDEKCKVSERPAVVENRPRGPGESTDNYFLLASGAGNVCSG